MSDTHGDHNLTNPAFDILNGPDRMTMRQIAEQHPGAFGTPERYRADFLKPHGGGGAQAFVDPSMT